MMRFAVDLMRKWNLFWFQEGPPHGLAVFRILFGIYWLIRWAVYLPHVTLLFSGAGLYFPKYPNPPGGIVHGFNDLIGLATQPVSPFAAWLIYLTSLILFIFVTAGLATRWSLALIFLLVNYYYYLYMFMCGTSYERLLIITTFVLIFSPCGKALSVDVWLARRSGHVIPANYLLTTQKMLCMEVAMLYLATGIHKITSPAWKSGDMLESSLYGTYGTAFGHLLAQLGLPLGFYDLLTITVILFELGMGFLLFSRRWRVWAIGAGTLFHIANMTILWIPQFAIVIFSYVLFAEPETIRAATNHYFSRFAG